MGAAPAVAQTTHEARLGDRGYAPVNPVNFIQFLRADGSGPGGGCDKLCDAIFFLTIFCAVHIFELFKQGAGQQASGATQKPGRTDPAKGKHMFKNIEDVQTFGKEQMETVTATATTFTKGMQEIAAQTSDYSKKSFEATQGLVEKMIGVKSIDKAFELQTEFSKQAYEGFVAQSTKVADLYTSLMKEAFKPVEAAFAKAQAAA